MVPEAQLEQTDEGLVAKSDGWFVLNARDARWYHAEGRSAFSDLEGDVDFTQLGFNISVLGPGEAMSMYHWEADQEDFLVVAGEAVLIIEGEERPLRQWDFVHCPPHATHTIVGAGAGPCIVVAVGAREHEGKPDWGGYTVDEVAARYGASSTVETTEPQEAYAHLTRRQPARYREGWLPDAST
ncbi:MAG TPA: cupin domain-containing protein [Gaiellaceae bacterium]|nr:cupin domain-containing protein [Gaiellaceae bacterium]